MSKWAPWSGSNTGLFVSAAAIAVAALVAGFYINNRAGPVPDAGGQATAPAAMADATPETAPATDGEVAEATQVPTGAETPPSIDEVRVEADGLTIVAGRAFPGSKVSVLLDGVENISVTADAGGVFAALTTIQTKTTAQVMTIVQSLGGTALPSNDEIILAPSAGQVAFAEALPEVGTGAGMAAQPTEAVTEPDAPQDAAENIPDAGPVADPNVVQLAPQPTASSDAAAKGGALAARQSEEATDSAALSVAQADAAQDPGAEPPAATTFAPTADALASDEPAQDAPIVTTSTPAPQAVTVLRSTPDGVDVLAPSLGPSDAIAIDTIGYSDAGDVQLAGRAKAQADLVRIYVDNHAILDLQVDAQGRWRGALPDIKAGVYTLRVDEVDAAGDVMSRVETPFKREDPQVLAAADTAAASSAKQITVQTGATLWAIARDRYGEGVLYVQVFEANRDAILDPDLIYPGQVFALPD